MSNLNGGLSGSGTLRGTLGGGGVPAQDVYWDDILNKPTFATVATSGSYNDLLDKPTIPPAPTVMTGATSQSNGVAGYVTQPLAGDQDKFLNGAGVWVTLPTSGINYLTEEHVIGTWIDGKPLYERSYSFTNTLSSFSDYVTIYNIPNIETVVRNFFTALRDLGQNEKLYYNGEGSVRPEHDVNYYINIREYNGNIQYRINNFGTQITDIVITTQYTKTTDTIGG